MGDLVLTTPIFRELKLVFPDAEITLLTSSGTGSVLNNNPHIDHFIWHKRKESYSELNYLIKKLYKNNFDLIYPDGDHSYHGVSVDIDNCCSLVRDGGILCGDDLEIQAITAMLRLR